jgi:hypothetical protein
LKKKIVLLFLLNSFSLISIAQSIKGSLGLVINFGSHVNKIGFVANVNFSYYFIQTNFSQTFAYQFSGYGERTNFSESRSAFGLVLLAGKRNIVSDFQFDALRHNTNYQYGIAYNYLIYKDKAQTSQLSGGWGLHINHFSMLFENDVFGGQAKDRFRTGILQLNYRYQNLNFFSKFSIWTGETKNSIWKKEAMPNCPNGYRSLKDLLYGKTSHGIASFGLNWKMYDNVIFTNSIGVDSEQIRHVLQNKLSHDLILIPKKYPRNTPHYPRLDENGLPIFEKSQRKKDNFYFQMGLNDYWSY